MLCNACRLFQLWIFSSILFLSVQSQDLSGSGAETKVKNDELEDIQTKEKKPPRIRLRGSVGNNPWEGRVEVMFKGQWGTVCDDSWSIENSHVVCRWLGYVEATEYKHSAHFGRGGGDILMDEVKCRGNETSLWRCRHQKKSDCYHSEDVGVRCNPLTIVQQKINKRKKKLRAMKLRLKSDSTLEPPSEGILEVLLNKKWRTICSDGWDIQDSKVVCGMLGFPDSLPLGDVGKTPANKNRRKSMQLTNVDCSGSEALFGDCDMDDLNDHKACSSETAAQIKCARGNLVLDAQEPMRFMKQRISTALEEDDIATPITATRNRNAPYGIQNEQPVSNSPSPWVRLRSGGNFGQGRVEVKIRGKWGTVCSTGWNKVAANVLCRQLGFGTVKELVMNAEFGQGVGPIWLHKVNCKGDETDLLDCRHGFYNSSYSCKHEHDAGVKCHVPDTGISEKARVVGGTAFSPNEGRALVEIDNGWGSICNEGWDLLDAAVLCRQMGMGFAKFALQRTNHYRAPNLDIVITDVKCDGSERMIQECSYRKLGVNDTCFRSYRAGVVCTDYLPDILLDVYKLQAMVYLQDWPEYLLQCAYEEGCLSSEPSHYGVRRLLRFDSAIMNRGTAAFRPFLDRSSWIWHACHVHYHSMEVFTHYDLLNLKGERVAQGHKASFCLEDVYCDSGATKYFSCDTYQGISPNCVDLYEATIDCQWIDITGVKPDSYLLRIDANPDLLVAESDYSNNEIVCSLYFNGYQVVVGACRYVADDDAW